MTALRKASYLGVLAGCLGATLPLELVLHTCVYTRPRRWLGAVAPVFAVFTAWDLAAIVGGWWSYDPAQVTGLQLPGRLPVEEALFFVVVPTCAILTLEAVRARRPQWSIGDE